jgi:hypothetical protein
MYLLEAWAGWTVISSIGSLLAAIIAAIYTVVTYKLLEKTNQTFQKTNTLTEFEIYRDIIALLNKTKSRKAISLCLTDNLIIVEADKDIVNDNYIKGSDINQLVLNPLEDLAMFWKKDLITIRTINEGIGYKILELGNCKTIVEHIEKTRKQLPNVFTGFEKLYKAVYEDSEQDERKDYNPDLFTQLKGKTQIINKDKAQLHKS